MTFYFAQTVMSLFKYNTIIVFINHKLCRPNKPQPITPLVVEESLKVGFRFQRTENSLQSILSILKKW